jgi:hypothetical protein
MYDCPDEACYQYRIIPTDVAGVLLLDQRVDQHLEGGLGFGNEVIILRGRLDESAEHQLYRHFDDKQALLSTAGSEGSARCGRPKASPTVLRVRGSTPCVWMVLIGKRVAQVPVVVWLSGLVSRLPLRRTSPIRKFYLRC